MKRLILVATLLVACSRPEQQGPPPPARPSILLVTMDTTRADAMTPEVAPAFNALASRGLRFNYAYATVPQTLPSHASMLTGLYPAGHGVHENARTLDAKQALVTEKLRENGYRTAAFISAFALARRFGLARGFDVWDEDFGEGKAERAAKETTDRALAELAKPSSAPLFLWVHYYDPHYPYTPSYLGEVAAMDEQLGRLVAAFEKSAPSPHAIAILSDHGEGLGEHGEQQHGNLLYQTTMHIPMLLVGPGVTAGTSDLPVSSRHVAHTLLDWAGINSANSLRRAVKEIVAGEAMKPFLDYGWLPQVMAVDGNQKAILSGRVEVYDIATDPAERRKIADANLSREARATLREYPIPSSAAAATTAELDEEGRRKLASLGYVASTAKPVVRANAPRPADMAHLFPILDRASGLFVREQYAEAIPLLETIAKADPYNLDAALRLATAHSSLGHDAEALAAFRRAEAIAPDSRDVRTYLALHLARGKQWQSAVPMLERVVNEEPDRVAALEGLAAVRERQGRIDDAIALRRRIYALRAPNAAELVRLGLMEMSLGQTAAAISSLEKARAEQGASFEHHLELGVLYLAAGRTVEARDALDRAPQTPMTLFKRAQVSVLLREPDAAQRIARARQNADATTRPLIERERLFR